VYIDDAFMAFGVDHGQQELAKIMHAPGASKTKQSWVQEEINNCVRNTIGCEPLSKPIEDEAHTQLSAHFVKSQPF